jgi:hypothetical protein
VEAQNYLGIYLSKDRATVTCVAPQAQGQRVLDCFSISVGQPDDQDQPGTFGLDPRLATLIAQSCAERELRFSEVAVALDCAMFMQHNVHSNFSTAKQIAATVRFDTEEALATDITDSAIAFQIDASDQQGSGLTVFTAKHKTLSDILASLQTNNIDPVTIEPDVACLSRFICQKIAPAESQQGMNLFGMLSDRRGYFVVLSKSQEAPKVRTFLVGPAQDRTELLAREALMTTTLTGPGEPITGIRVFDSCESADIQQIGEKLGIEASDIDLVAAAELDRQTLADCNTPLDFAIAYGAALSLLEKSPAINFRNDFMPYQGRKLRLQKTLKFLSMSLTVLLLAVGLYLQVTLLQKNRDQSRLSKELAKQYSTVMMGKKPPAKTSPVRRLASELRRVRDLKSGQRSVTGEESISAKLTLLFDAFNKSAALTNLNIDSISVTARNMTISGDTSSRSNTLRFFEAVKGSGLDIVQHGYDAKGGRDSFTIRVVPKKT